LEGLSKSKTVCEKSRIIAVILRKTYGWNKKEDWISLSQFAKLTGIKRNNISRILKKLLEDKTIIRNGESYGINEETFDSEGGIQTDASGGIELEQKGHQDGSQLASNRMPTIDTTQKKTNNIQKTEGDFLGSPSLEQVVEFFEKNGGNVSQAKIFFCHYKSIDWMVGRNKMTDWSAKAMGWIIDAAGKANAGKSQIEIDSETLTFGEMIGKYGKSKYLEFTNSK